MEEARDIRLLLKDSFIRGFKSEHALLFYTWQHLLLSPLLLSLSPITSRPSPSPLSLSLSSPSISPICFLCAFPHDLVLLSRLFRPARARLTILGGEKPAKSSAEDEIRAGEIKRKGSATRRIGSGDLPAMESLALGNGPSPASAAAASSSVSSAGAGGQTVSSPCAGCKFLRRKCQPDCVFAPYFPPDQPQRFVNVHRVFGASNVTKILNELHPLQREDAVNSLAYEADMRLRDPVYGCVGIISLLQHQLRQLQMDLSRARSELSKYQSAAAGIGSVEQFFIPGVHQQQQRMLMMKSYAAAAELGGSYDAGLVTVMNGPAAAGMGTFVGQFARSTSAAGGDDRQSALGSS